MGNKYEITGVQLGMLKAWIGLIEAIDNKTNAQAGINIMNLIEEIIAKQEIHKPIIIPAPTPIAPPYRPFPFEPTITWANPIYKMEDYTYV